MSNAVVQKVCWGVKGGSGPTRGYSVSAGEHIKANCFHYFLGFCHVGENCTGLVPLE